MERFKSILLFVFAGALVGEVVASFFAPKFIVWYNTPGAGVGDAICNPGTIISDTIASYVQWQLVGGAVGALSGLILGAIVVRAQAKKAATATTDTTPPRSA